MGYKIHGSRTVHRRLNVGYIPVHIGFFCFAKIIWWWALQSLEVWEHFRACGQDLSISNNGRHISGVSGTPWRKIFSVMAIKITPCAFPLGFGVFCSGGSVHIRSIRVIDPSIYSQIISFAVSIAPNNDRTKAKGVEL